MENLLNIKRYCDDIDVPIVFMASIPASVENETDGTRHFHMEDVDMACCKFATENQMEYVSVPAYDSYYIEGINNIYEMDADPTSGWTYTVNGEYPSFGVNKYVLENGDKVVFDYILSY